MGFYHTLFELELQHDYYKNGYCEDFKLWPSEVTLKYIKNNRMIFKPTQRGFKVLYPILDKDGTPFFEIENSTFIFLLNMLDFGVFCNITNLNTTENTFEKSNKILFRNINSSEPTLQQEIINHIRPNLFTFILPFAAVDIENDEAELNIYSFPKGDAPLQTFAGLVPDKNGFYSQRVELPVKDGEKYIFSMSDPNHAEVEKLIYIDNLLVRKELIGIIEIAFVTGGTQKFELKLSRKNTFWKYAVINKNKTVDFSHEKLTIIDTSSENQLPYGKYVFTPGNQPDTVNKVDGYETVLFKSDKPIPFYQLPKLNFQLKKQDNSSVTDVVKLFEHLPNPKQNGLVNDQNESIIYVFI